MTEPNNQSPTDTQNEKMIDSLRNEIAALKSQLKRKDERIATLDVMLNQVMESHTAGVRVSEDLEGKLEDVIEMLRRRVPHGDILAYLKIKDSNEYQFKKLW
jgi:predicted RNase H-like nuclease (RuvC/YqgF family)